MNIRIDSGSLRFKISEQEMQQLLAGQVLESSLRVSGHALQVIISPDPQLQAMTPELSCADNQIQICLRVPAADVQTLSAMGRSREGLQKYGDGDELAVSLQVDFRTDSRRKAR